MPSEFIYEPDEAGCSSDKHRAMVEVVTFTEIPDGHFATYIDGTADTVVQRVKEIKASASPNASLYVSWCCKKCEEAANG
jgi:hypothetical protein